MTLEISVREKLYRALRNVRPAAVVVVPEEGDERPIAVVAGKHKWENVADAVLAMDDADRVEFRNADGAVLRVWRPAQRPRFVEPETPAAPVQTGVVVATDPLDAQVNRMEAFALRVVGVVRDAEAAAVQRYAEGLKETMDATIAVMRSIAEQNKELMAQQGAMLTSLYDATLARAQAEVALEQSENARAEAEEKASTDAMVKGIVENVGEKVVTQAAGAMMGKLANLGEAKKKAATVVDATTVKAG